MRQFSTVLPFVLILLISILSRVPGFSEPMPAAAPEEAIQDSQAVVVASYQYYRATKIPVDYFDGVTATYKIERVLRGSLPDKPKTIQVHYRFEDGSACEAPKGWLFSARMLMPATNAKWILFLLPLTPEQNGRYETYRGDYGRWPYNPEKIQKVQSLPAKSK